MSILRPFLVRLRLRPRSLVEGKMPTHWRLSKTVKCPCCRTRVNATEAWIRPAYDFVDLIADPPTHIMHCPNCDQFTLVGAIRVDIPAPTRLEDVVVPAPALERANPAYRPDFLKAAWFVASCFNPGTRFNERAAKEVISLALRQLDQTGGLRSTEDTLRVLLRIGWFEDLPGEHRYRMTMDPRGERVDQGAWYADAAPQPLRKEHLRPVIRRLMFLRLLLRLHIRRP